MTAQRKGYRKSVKIALELTDYFRTHTVCPVSAYIAEKGVTDTDTIDNIYRVARICGRNVTKRKGVWYENRQGV